jgi:hypothetical protein
MDDKPLVNRLLSGIIIFRLNKDYVQIKPAKVEDKAFADFYAQEVYEDALLDGCYTQKDIENLLVKNGWWDEDQQKKMEELEKNLEQMKLDYFTNFFKEEQKKYIKRAIERQIKKLNKLHNKKYLFFDKTCEYVRDFANTSVLISRCAFLSNGDLAIDKINAHRLVNFAIDQALPEDKIRNTSKGTAWRMIWNAKEVSNLFDQKGGDLTNEQISAIGWSRFYDSVYESMDKPSDEIIADNLALDGWSISQDRKRKEEEKKQEGEKLVNDKMQNAGELLIPVSSDKEKEQVLALNDKHGKSVIRSKKKQFSEGGTFNENELSHVKKEIQMESIRQFKENRRR